MKVSVEVRLSGGGETKIDFDEPAELLVGRDPACDVSLPESEVSASAKHLRLSLRDRQVFFEDLNSSNGVFLDGTKVSRGSLSPRQELSLGRQGPKVRVHFIAPTVKAGGTCPVGVAGSAPKGKGLTVGLTEAGQEPVPPGFNKADIAKVILASSAVVGIAAAIKAAGAGGAASAAGGASGAAAGAASGSAAGAAAGVTAGAAAAGGISTGILIAGGVAVAAGGVAAAAGAGGGSDSEPSPPSLTAGASPTSGQAPLAVQFSANASGGTSPYSYSWSFGDGGLSTMQSPAYTYRGAGSFTASVTVTDGKQKTDTKSTYVTVSGPPPLKFLEADVNWSGGGDLNVGILRGGAAVSGATTIPAGCDASGRSPTERALLQGTAFSSGTYTQVVTAQACSGDGAGTGLTGVLTVLTDQGTKCQEFFTVTPGATWAAPQACQVVQP